MGSLGTSLDDILDRYPRPIAWALYEADTRREPVSRLHQLAAAAEETTRYLALVSLSSYLEQREAAGDERIEQELLGLQRPAFGHWASSLRLLTDHLAEKHQDPFDGNLYSKCNGEAARSIARFAGFRSKASPTLFHVIDALGALRNRIAHSQRREGLARELNEILLAALVEMLGALKILVRHELVFCSNVARISERRIVADIYPLIGTSRPRRRERKVEDPELLDLVEGRVYVWGKRARPLGLAPLLHFRRLDERLFLFSGVKGGRPKYTSCETGDPCPEEFADSFRRCAGFLLEGSDVSRTSQRSINRMEIYERQVMRADSDEIVTPDEWALLEGLRKDLGIPMVDARGVLTKHGIRIPTGAEDDATPSANLQKKLDAAEELNLSDDIDGAIVAYRSILEGDPLCAKARADIAALLLETSRHEEAEAICREGLGLCDDALVRAALSSVLLDTNRKEEAYEQAYKARSIDPQIVDGYIALADCFSMDGETRELRKLYDEAQKIHPNDIMLKAGRLVEGSSFGEDPFEVISKFRQLLRLSPRNRLIRISYVAVIINVEGYAPEAVQETTKLIARNPRSHIALGFASICRLRTGDIEGAERFATQALDVFPRSWLGRLARAYVLLYNLDSEGSLALVTEILRDWPRSPVIGEVYAEALNLVGKTSKAISTLRGILRTSPRNNSVRLSLASMLLESGRAEEALTEAEKVLERRPDSEEARVRTASILDSLGRLDEAEKLIEGLRETSEVLLVRAFISSSRENYRAADVLLMRSCELDPINAPARIHLIQVKGLLGRRDEALDVFEKAAVKTPHLRLALARALANGGEVDQAREILESLRNETAIDAVEAASIAEQCGLYELRIDFARKSVSWTPGSSPANHVLASCLHDMGEAEEAELFYRRALEIDPSNTDARNNLATMLTQLDRAPEVLELLSEPEPKELGARVTVQILRAWSHLQLGDRDRMMAEVQKGLDASPSEATYVQFADSLLSWSDVEGCRQITSKGLGSFPRSIELHRTCAAYLAAEGSNQGALSILQKAAVIEPGNPFVLVDIAQTYENLGQPWQALPYRRRVYELHGDDEAVAFSYGLCLTRLGELEKARELILPLVTSSDDPSEVLYEWLHIFASTYRFTEGLELVRSIADSIPEPSRPVCRAFEATFMACLNDDTNALPLFEEVWNTATFARWDHVVCLTKLGRWAEGVRRLEEMLVQDPTSVPTLRLLVRCYAGAGNTATAKETLEHLLELSPEDEEKDELTSMVSG